MTCRILRVAFFGRSWVLRPLLANTDSTLELSIWVLGRAWHTRQNTEISDVPVTFFYLFYVTSKTMLFMNAFTKTQYWKAWTGCGSAFFTLFLFKHLPFEQSCFTRSGLNLPLLRNRWISFPAREWVKDLFLNNELPKEQNLKGCDTCSHYFSLYRSNGAAFNNGTEGTEEIRKGSHRHEPA